MTSGSSQYFSSRLSCSNELFCWTLPYRAKCVSVADVQHEWRYKSILSFELRYILFRLINKYSVSVMVKGRLWLFSLLWWYWLDLIWSSFQVHATIILSSSNLFLLFCEFAGLSCSGRVILSSLIISSTVYITKTSSFWFCFNQSNMHYKFVHSVILCLNPSSLAINRRILVSINVGIWSNSLYLHFIFIFLFVSFVCFVFGHLDEFNRLLSVSLSAILLCSLVYHWTKPWHRGTALKPLSHCRRRFCSFFGFFRLLVFLFPWCNFGLWH